MVEASTTSEGKAWRPAITMMKMNGDLDDMGMQMSLNQMDMNVVMYPEITGEMFKKEDGNWDELFTRVAEKLQILVDKI